MNTYARENNNGDRGATEFLLFNLKPTDGFAKPARDMFYEPSQPFLIKDLLDDVTSAVCSYYSAEEDPSGGATGAFRWKSSTLDRFLRPNVGGCKGRAE